VSDAGNKRFLSVFKRTMKGISPQTNENVLKKINIRVANSEKKAYNVQ
jgi:hypothetical protein